MRRAAVVVSLGLLVGVVGCGQGQVAISGTVTLDGDLLEEGNIAFRPMPVSARSAAIVVPIKGGKYQATVRPGQYRVEITATRAADGPKGALGTGPPPISIIPEKYNSKSELTREVRADGTNEFDFALTSR